MKITIVKVENYNSKVVQKLDVAPTPQAVVKTSLSYGGPEHTPPFTALPRVRSCHHLLVVSGPQMDGHLGFCMMS